MNKYTLEEQAAINELAEFIRYSGCEYITDKWLKHQYPALSAITREALEIARKLATILRLKLNIETTLFSGGYLEDGSVLAVMLKSGDIMFYHPKSLMTIIMDESTLKLKLLRLEKLMQYRTGHMIYDLPEQTMTWVEAIALLERKAWQK